MARVLYSAFDVVPSPKGASTHVEQFVRGLVAAGHEVTLATPRAPGLPDEDAFAGARHVRLGTPGGGNFLARAAEFGDETAALAAAERPYDVLQYRSFWTGLPLVATRDPRRTVAVFEANSLASVELPFHYPGLRGTPTVDKIHALELAALRASDAVVCVSRVTREYLAGLGVPAGRLRVIPNGVDTGRFVPAPPPAGEGRTPVILYVGTLAEWQGLPALVDAMAAVVARRPARLVVVGRGRSRQRKDLARRIRRAGLEAHVEVRAAVAHADVPELIALADVAAAPLGYNERNVVQGCCPLKVLEYAACARPIVASNLPVVRELVRDGREAMLVPPDAPDALAAAILRVLEDPRLAQRLGRRAAERVARRFTWARAQGALLSLYDDLLARRATAVRRRAARARG